MSLDFPFQHTKHSYKDIPAPNHGSCALASAPFASGAWQTAWLLLPSTAIPAVCMWDASQQTGDGIQPLCLPAFPPGALPALRDQRGVNSEAAPSPATCSSSGLPLCCHQPMSAQAQSRFVGGGKCSELLCWECEEPLFWTCSKGLSSLLAFLQQEIPPREKEHTGAAPPAVPARVPRSAAGDQPVSPGEQVPRQPGRAGKGSRQRGLHLRGAVLFGQPCRKM